MEWIRENGGPLVIAGIALAIGAAYLEWRIDAITTQKTGALEIVPTAKIEAMEGDIADNKAYIRKTEDKVERIVDILLEE